MYLKGSAPAAILVKAHQQASGWRDSKEIGILNVLSRESEPGETAGCWLCLPPGGFLLAQQRKGRKSKEKRSSRVSASRLPIKPSSVDQTQQVTNDISNIRHAPDL